MPEIDIQTAIKLARSTQRILKVSAREAAESTPLIPRAMLDEVIETIETEDANNSNIIIEDPSIIMSEAVRGHTEWLHKVDRKDWVYWPALRSYLLEEKHWPTQAVSSIDDTTDRSLSLLENPRDAQPFDRRGLVVGYIQSGKTANYSALIAKAADCGYRLIIVLAGIHNLLRQQTQRRLNTELLQLPRIQDPKREWVAYTSGELDGDFKPGNIDAGALSLEQPSLMVVKKNATVLRKLSEWFDGLSQEKRKALSVLVIDDEADQASPNTGGNLLAGDLEDEDEDEMKELEENEPSKINGLVRGLLDRFDHTAYVGYTASPFANVLINHRAEDAQVGRDLYPESFIVSLPEPIGYYGPRKIFGSREDPEGEDLGVIRHVHEEDVSALVPSPGQDKDLFRPMMPPSLESAVYDFVLAGAARIARGQGNQPSSMLVHTTHLTALQDILYGEVNDFIENLRNEWRYNRAHSLETRLSDLWDTDFRPTIEALNIADPIDFDSLISSITEFLESGIQVIRLNSASEDTLDYARFPELKTLVVGGNRLSRGLTLEGLLVSYYVRRANAYDTLLQMGRWFGFREGYADLTRIYTTPELEGWFRDLVDVEAEIRNDIQRYADEGKTPREFGVRIRQHPALQITSPLKMKAAQVASISFSGQLVQTIKFPFEPERDDDFFRENIAVTGEFLSSLGSELRDADDQAQAAWSGVPVDLVIRFIQEYNLDPSNANKGELVRYIEEQQERGELVEWAVGLMGQKRHEPSLGALDFGVDDVDPSNLVSRTRIEGLNSLGVLTSPKHLMLGLSDDELRLARERSGRTLATRLREVRGVRQGLLLIYPVSRFSGWSADGSRSAKRGRMPINQSSREDASTRPDVVGVALSFPASEGPVGQDYVVGSVGDGR